MIMLNANIPQISRLFSAYDISTVTISATRWCNTALPSCHHLSCL